jgi:hypothetical protein
MEHAKIHLINRHIRKAAEDAAAGQLSVPAIERFLRTVQKVKRDRWSSGCRYATPTAGAAEDQRRKGTEFRFRNSW